MKITRHRISKAWVCYKSHRENGANIISSIRCARWWFSSGFTFEGDK